MWRQISCRSQGGLLHSCHYTSRVLHLACVPTSMCAGRSTGSPQQKHRVPKEVRSEVIARGQCQGLHTVHMAQGQRSREEDGQGQNGLSGAWHLRRVYGRGWELAGRDPSEEQMQGGRSRRGSRWDSGFSTRPML